MSTTHWLAALSLAAGLGLSRITPLWRGGEEHESVPLAVTIKNSAPGPNTARHLDFSGDWKAQAAAWAREDPAGLQEWLTRRGLPPDGDLLEILFLTWMERDPEAAFTAALNLPRDFMTSGPAPGLGILNKMFRNRLEQPGGWKHVLQWSRRLDRTARDLSGQISISSKTWLDSASSQEIASALAGCDPPVGCMFQMVSQFTESWSIKDPHAALDWMRQLPASLRRAAFGGYLNQWAARDPAAALEYLAREGTSDQREMSDAPLQSLARTDPQAAVGWWEKNTNRQNAFTLNNLMEKWNASDPSAARDWVFALSNPALKRSALASWTSSAEIHQILSTLRTILPGKDSRQIFDQLLGDSDRSVFLNYYGRYKPGEVGEQIRQLVADPARTDITSRTISLTAHFFAEENPRAAWDWALALPEDRRAAAAKSVVYLWHDKIAAAEAVAKLPDEPVKEAAMKSLK